MRGVSCFFFALQFPALAINTTVDDTDRYSWNGNIGWQNWQGAIQDGVAVIRDYCQGYLWDANSGWIHFGDGNPVNSTSYSNSSKDDYGVNVDRDSDPDFYLLSGYAWGANIGWINFNVAGQTGEADRPKTAKSTGIFSGYAWGANVGWISLGSINHTLKSEVLALTSSGLRKYLLGQKMLDSEEEADADSNTDGAIDFSDLVHMVANGK